MGARIQTILLTGESLPEVWVESCQTVEDVKRTLAPLCATPVLFQRLLLGHRILCDSCTLEAEGLEGHTQLQLVRLQPDRSLSLLHILEDDPVLVSYLLRCGADPDERGGSEETALIHAARRGFSGVCLALLRSPKFTQVDATDVTRRTALHWASEQGLADVCAALVRHPRFTKCCNARDAYGLTALQLAAGSGHVAVVQALAAFSDFRHLSEALGGGLTALHEAAARDDLAMCSLLLDHPQFSAANRQDDYGRTALHWAAEAGHLSVVRLLLDSPRFTVVEALDSDGQSALQCACCGGHQAVVDLLSEHTGAVVPRMQRGLDQTCAGELLHEFALDALVCGIVQ